MVGGKKEHLDTCLPVLEAMGSRVEHMGGWGAGAAAKLVNQVQAVNIIVRQYCKSKGGLATSYRMFTVVSDIDSRVYPMERLFMCQTTDRNRFCKCMTRRNRSRW